MSVTYTSVWTGGMEAHGECPGLSCYQGGSQLLVAMTRTWLMPAEAGRIRGRDTGPRQYTRSHSLDQAIRERLGQGHTYRAIARELGCSYHPVRRVAREACERQGKKDRESFSIGLNRGAR